MSRTILMVYEHKGGPLILDEPWIVINLLRYCDNFYIAENQSLVITNKGNSIVIEREVNEQSNNQNKSHT